MKNVSFSEILNPVVVDDGTENIPLIYEAAAAWGIMTMMAFGFDRVWCDFTGRKDTAL